MKSDTNVRDIGMEATSGKESMLSLVLAEVPQPAIVLGRNGRILAVNHRLEQLINFTATQLRYLKKIHKFSVRKPASGAAEGEYELMVYGKAFMMNGRRILSGDGSGDELILFSGCTPPSVSEEPPASFSGMIGRSKPFLAAVEACRRSEGRGQIVLLHGESGTGKETLARCMHREGPFPDRKFICICNNMEFTAFFASAPNTGTSWYDERLHEHTLYIDEAANFNHYNQDRLFYLLHNSPISNYKIICSTSSDLELLLRRGEWHRNLYDILEAHRIDVPALRQRREDIVPFADYFLARANARLVRRLELSPQLKSAMQSYDWPGNLHEMESFLYTAVRASPAVDGELPERFFNESVYKNTGKTLSSDFTIARAERALILRALNAFSGVAHPKAEAARALGISLATLYRKLALYDIQQSGLYEE